MVDLLNQNPALFLCAVMAVVGIASLLIGVQRRSLLLAGLGLCVLMATVLVAGIAGLMTQPLMPNYQPIGP